ncbi:TRAF-type zinc finger domain-containing protein 1-like isoform X2 [Metopolophium dirhodum]|uniref:TRAF-type zinc finger domain-containing protein 1-like isoform X2 n=1 Tax=Metopolophium dirhodum TaxID=44670 RepID=UPI0029906B11|nr:TRAF-type zinc finger domain-containing protein 1-like isoform X2 [Metopolophium dirhodum]
MNPNENEEDTKYCFNCRRNIPLINHVMHTAYCHRNLKLCMKCDEPFLTSDYEEHQKTMHSVILCDACSEKLEAMDLESHKLNDCRHRMQTCNYCQIDVEACLLPAHTDMCSSRTERCNSCGQFIMLKFLDVHQETHERKELLNVAKSVIDDSPSSLAAYPPLIKKVPNIAVTARPTTKTTSMPTLRLHESTMTNHRVMPPVKRNNDQPQINTHSSNDNTHKDPKKNMPIVDTPSDIDDDDDDEFPVLGAYSIPNNHSANINNHLTNEYNNFSDTLESVKLPCEFCLEMIDSENLVLHETGCRPDLATFHNVLQTNNKNTNSENNIFPIPPHDLDTSSSSGDSELNLNTLSLSSEDEDDSEKINVEKLPCEFCEKLVSIKKFLNHQWRCEKLHLDLPVINNFDKDVYPQPIINTNTKFPKSVNLLETQRNLFKTTSAPANLSGRTLTLRNSEANAQSPASSTYDAQTRQILPRVKLNRQNPSRPNIPMDNRYVNNSARNNYVQFISNSRLNHSERASTINNSPAYLNPSSGAIPKQKNMKPSNNRRVINDLSKKKRRDSDSSSD